MKINGITVCVEFDDILAITLPYRLLHLDRLLVITTPADLATQQLCRRFPRVDVHTTDVFYARGAEFNKGAAIEEGFDVLGRSGWIMSVDADIVLPPDLDLGRTATLSPERLYGARRRLLADMHQWRGQVDWSGFPLIPDGEIAGYFQLFHAAGNPALHGRPWYGVDCRSAATCDSHFFAKFGWDQGWLNQEVLHLGPYGDNWCGRTVARLDGRVPAEATERAAARQRIVEARQTGRADYEFLSGEL